jgi:putative tryptophan/tyrosine transport system substrate-binding protein
MNTRSDGVVESWSVGSARIKAVLHYSNIPILRLRLCLTLCVMLFALTESVEAQHSKKIPRIGYLSPLDPDTDAPRSNPLRAALRELGYIEGQSIAIEYRYMKGNYNRLSDLAAGLVRLEVDLIVAAGGDPAIRAAMNATKTIPILMMGQGSDPVEAGFVQSLARPGGNVTGLTRLSRELGGKRLELLKETVPNVVRVAAIYGPSPGAEREVKEDLPAAAGELGLNVRSWQIRETSGFDRVFAALNKERPDGLYPLMAGPLINTNVNRIAGFALKSRLPSVGNSPYVHAGGLISYATDVSDTHRRMAIYVDRILKGAKPADLPVERPTKFELLVNLKTAKQIGLTIPPNVLARADKVIK